MSSHIPLFGFRFMAAPDVQAIASDIMAAAAGGFGGKTEFLITPNAYTLVHYGDAAYQPLKRHYAQSAWILPDGMPVVWMSRLKKGPQLPARLTGSDLFPVLWHGIRDAGYPVTLVVPNEAAATLFRKDYDRAETLVPIFFSEHDEAYIEDFAAGVADSIIRNRSRFVFIGLNFPKAEKLGIQIAAALERKAGREGMLILLLGASFEFYFGLKKRAPAVFRKTGLEWLHRLLTEPRRLWKRYTVDNVRFLLLAAREWMGRGKGL